MPKGLGLTIGLNRVDTASPAYQRVSIPPLEGCENDANSIAQLLGRQPGFDSPITLINEQATRTAVLDELTSAAAQLNPGDLFVLHISCHGMQGSVSDDGVPDPNSSDTRAWVLFDGPLGHDELFNAWFPFKKGVRILVLSDSCFSGTAIKMIGSRGIRFMERGLSQAARVQVIKNQVEFFKVRVRSTKAQTDAGKVPNAAVLLISGCQNSETSLDTVDAAGDPHGLFTATLLEVWNNGSFSGDYVQFHSQIQQRTNAQSMNIDPGHNQHPNRFVQGNIVDVSDFQQSSPPFTV